MTTRPTTRIGGLVGLGLASASAAVAVIMWLERTYAPGVGWLWLALTIALGGVGVTLMQRRSGSGAVCAPGPRVSPLQISCLALQAAGVLLYHNAQNPLFRAAFPVFSVGWLPLLCILGGVLGLGLLSINGTCRNADLEGRV
jgi:hypothetical protein